MIDGKPLKQWLRNEWQRAGLTLNTANEVCGVKNAATRKYLTQCDLWYFPPPEMFEKLSEHANKQPGGPYFAVDGQPLTPDQWNLMRPIFNCLYGVTNVWERNTLRGKERIKGSISHLNQKPLDLMTLLIETSSNVGDVVWEPFGGLFSGSLAASLCGRRAFGCEINYKYYRTAVERFCETA